MLITLDNVGKSYGIDIIVQGVSAVVNENDRIGIIGENGAGKTTILSYIVDAFYELARNAFREEFEDKPNKF